MSFGNNVYNTLNGVNLTAWTPSVAFGGASVGITYTTQNGFYERIGNIVFYHVIITLSSKGSSTGDMTIEGLPFVVSANSNGTGVSVARFGQITLNANYTAMSARPLGTTSYIQIQQVGSAQSAINVTDTNIANNSFISFCGFYFV